MVLELFAFGDESGIGREARWCVMGGFSLPSERAWKEFRTQWRATLDSESVPQFHAADFYNATNWLSTKSPYYGWDHDRATKFHDRLLTSFRQVQRRLNPSNCAVNVPDFNELPLEHRQFATGALLQWTVWGPETYKRKLKGTGKPSTPWFLAFRDFVMRVLEHVPEGAKLHIILDRQDQYAGLAHHVWNDFSKWNLTGWERLGDLTFARSDDYEPLQLADMYTNNLGAWLTREDTEGAYEPQRVDALVTFAKRDPKVHIYDAREAGRRIRDIIEEGKRKIALHYEHDESETPEPI